MGAPGTRWSKTVAEERYQTYRDHGTPTLVELRKHFARPDGPDRRRHLCRAAHARLTWTILGDARTDARHCSRRSTSSLVGVNEGEAGAGRRVTFLAPVNFVLTSPTTKTTETPPVSFQNSTDTCVGRTPSHLAEQRRIAPLVVSIETLPLTDSRPWRSFGLPLLTLPVCAASRDDIDPMACQFCSKTRLGTP